MSRDLRCRICLLTAAPLLSGSVLWILCVDGVTGAMWRLPGSVDVALFPRAAD